MTADPRKSLHTILVVHNYYQQPGGEDQVFAAETALLEQHGHRVIRHIAHNDQVNTMNRLALARATIWNTAAQRDLRALIQREQPDLIHFHNTFVMLSPAVYYTCQQAGIPVVQTLHNYRLICPNALLLRDKGICHDCLGKKIPWPGVLHACYRQSRAQSAVTAAMLSYHHWRNTWSKQVDRYIALSEFARQQFIAGGLPAHKIMVKSNFLHPDPGQKTGSGDYALFIGRLSAEKGIHTLLKAWARGLDVPLKIVGDGPLMPDVQAAVREHRLSQVEVPGRQPRSNIFALLQNARFLVFPSELYENFPVTLLEAFACGVPVLASNLGSTAEIVDDGHTGWLFKAGDAADLATQAARLWAAPAEAMRMGQAARAAFEGKYTAAQNYLVLSEIYAQARAHHAQSSQGT